jgi:hypothetical protein
MKVTTEQPTIYEHDKKLQLQDFTLKLKHVEEGLDVIVVYSCMYI